MAKKRIFGEYAGDGRPPPSHERPLTEAEEAGELGKAKQYFAEQDQLVKDNYQQFHAALRRAFPFDKCWPELKPQEP